MHGIMNQHRNQIALWLPLLLLLLFGSAACTAQSGTSSIPSPTVTHVPPRPTLAAVPPPPEIITSTAQTGLPTDTLLIRIQDDMIVSVGEQIKTLRLLHWKEQMRFAAAEDGSYVAYAKQGEPLVAMHLPTGQHLILTDYENSFTFTPDSRFLAYICADNRQWQIRTLDLHTRQVRTIRQEAGRVPPDHLLASPDSRYLAYGLIANDLAQVWMIDVETGNGLIVYEGHQYELNRPSAYPLAWAEQALLIHQTDDHAINMWGWQGHNLMQVDLTTTLTHTLGQDFWPHLASDSQHVALLRTIDGSPSTLPVSTLQVVNLATRQMTPITPTWTTEDGQVLTGTLGVVPLRKWAPDSSRLLYSWDPTSWQHGFLSLVDEDGQQLQTMVLEPVYDKRVPGTLLDAVWLNNEAILLLMNDGHEVVLYTLSADQFRVDALEEIARFPVAASVHRGSIIHVP